MDLNPFAIEISRFRLLIVALQSSGIETLREAPHFHFNLAAGDSLLHGSRVSGGGIERSLFNDRLQHFYETEDAEQLKRILGQSYQVVVGNPPYINVEDTVLREAYRIRFKTCSGAYQLGVPFTERFFDLTTPAVDHAISGGWMGMIVSNAFMSRSFGRVLVKDYLSKKDLTHIIDTSGLNLPGHGTPTTILLARNRRPLVSTSIRVVRGIVGILTQGEDLANSTLWREIVEHIDESSFEGNSVSIGDAPRSLFAVHPWVMGGGGAAELKSKLDSTAKSTLKSIIEDSGRMTHTGEDEGLYLPFHSARTLNVSDWCKTVVVGGDLRDWTLRPTEVVIFPYDENCDDRHDFTPSVNKYYWPLRTTLRNRKDYGRFIEDRGLRWQNHSMMFPARVKAKIFIGVAEIATHNHFVLSGGGGVFNQTAPILKLRDEASEREYLELIGLLNSSVGCFWLRQVAHDKGGGGVGGGLSSEPWERRKCFTVTVVSAFPIPADKPLAITSSLQTEAQSRNHLLPEAICTLHPPNRVYLEESRKSALEHLGRMISLQEELDWTCYHLYGIVDQDLASPPDQVPRIEVGQRAFEILMARRFATGDLDTTWFERHRANLITEPPSHWPEGYKELVERRISEIENNGEIACVERPEYKRRWNLESWGEMEKAALKGWLLDRVESKSIWKDCILVSCAQLRDVLARDSDWLSVAEIYEGNQIEALDAFVIKLLIPEAIPFLPVLRYTETGLRKRGEWEVVWALQRDEDAGKEIEIPVPPKYASKDMLKSDYWRLRGGLDVPKERFILYPSLERDSDASPVLGWSGWSHLEQARALAIYFQTMRTEEGWEPERLKPILAGLLDVKPWLLQWHNELDPELGESLSDYFVRYTEAQCQELGFSQEEVLAWQPNTLRPPQRRRRTAR